MNNFGLAQIDKGDFFEAEAVLAESLSVHRQKYPQNWATFRTQARLGKAFWQKKFAEVESNLTAGYEGMKPHEEEKISDQFRETLELLIQVYETGDHQGDAERASKWKSELESVDGAEDRP